MDKPFAISDLFLASYLEYRGIPSQLENRHGKIVFLFPQSDTLYKLLNAFNQGDPVPISEYLDVYKTLKVKMFNARGGAR